MIEIETIQDEKLKNFLKVQNTYVLKNTKVVTPDTLGHEYLYHISYKKRQAFIPNVSKRAREDEDNSFLRVHVSTNFLKCCLGHGAVLGDVVLPNRSYVKGTSLYFYAFDFEYAISPDNTVTPDSSRTEEHWLFAYDQSSPLIKSSFVCEFIPINGSVVPGTSKTFKYTVTFRMAVPQGRQIKLTDDVVITEGVWEFDITSGSDFIKDAALNNVKKSKDISVVFESSEPAPRYLSW